MDLLDVAIDATLKGTVSHYVRKSLEKIDTGLELIFRTGKPEAIKQYVTDKQLIQPLTDLASQTLRGSFVVPAMPESIATVEDRAELFRNVLQFGFNLSHRLQVDLVLPGSLHSPNTISVFRRNRAKAAEVMRVGNKVSLPEGKDYQNQLFLLPAPADEVGDWFKAYKSKVTEHLTDDSGYFSYNIVETRTGWGHCRLVVITAGSCFFEYPNLLSNGEFKNFFQPKDGKAAIQDWSGGLRRMFAAVSEVPNLWVLSDAERKEVADAYELFQRLN